MMILIQSLETMMRAMTLLDLAPPDDPRARAHWQEARMRLSGACDSVRLALDAEAKLPAAGGTGH